MRVTEKKLAANRKNAQKSTGPKTKEGKEVASVNNTKHGIFARALIINAPKLKEDLHEYNRLVYALVHEFQPEGMFEDYLVRKIVNCMWRARRVIYAETAQIERQIKDADRGFEDSYRFQELVEDHDGEVSEEEKEQLLSIQIGIKSIPEPDASRYISRYEMRLDRQLSRAIRILHHVQKRRKANNGDDGEALKKAARLPYNPVVDNPLHDID